MQAYIILFTAKIINLLIFWSIFICPDDLTLANEIIGPITFWLVWGSGPNYGYGKFAVDGVIVSKKTIFHTRGKVLNQWLLIDLGKTEAISVIRTVQ